LAILNSSVAQFIYQREFNSIKVLRSHIEKIPIPLVDYATQNKIIHVTDKLISGLEPTEAQMVYEELDMMISELFMLNSHETKIIKKATNEVNKYLA
jgi:hypothetical protein